MESIRCQSCLDYADYVCSCSVVFCKNHYGVHGPSNTSHIAHKFQVNLQEEEKTILENATTSMNFSLTSLISQEIKCTNRKVDDLLQKLKVIQRESALRIDYYISCQNSVKDFQRNISQYRLSNFASNLISREVFKVKETEGINKRGVERLKEEFVKRFKEIANSQSSNSEISAPVEQNPASHRSNSSISQLFHKREGYSNLVVPKKYKEKTERNVSDKCAIF